MNFLKKLKDVFTKNVEDTSGVKKLNQTDVAKVVKTGAFVGIAAGIASVLNELAPDTFGKYQPVIVLVLTIAMDFVNKLVKNNKK